MDELPDEEASWKADADDSDVDENGDDADATMNRNDDDGEEDSDDSSDDVLTKKRKKEECHPGGDDDENDCNDAPPKTSGKKLKAAKTTVALGGEDVDSPFSVKASASPARLF